MEGRDDQYQIQNDTTSFLSNNALDQPNTTLIGRRLHFFNAQIVLDALKAIVFIIYAFGVEADQSCYTYETGETRSIPLNEDDRDVSISFQVVILGSAATCVIDFIARFVRLRATSQTTKMKAGLITFLYLFSIIGFFIAIHVVRFSDSGVMCSETLLQQRGNLLLGYVIIVWTLILGILVGGNGYRCYKNRQLTE